MIDILTPFLAATPFVLVEGVTPPAASYGWIEFTAGKGRVHYTAAAGQVQATSNKGRMHYEASKEDRWQPS